MPIIARPSLLFLLCVLLAACSRKIPDRFVDLSVDGVVTHVWQDKGIYRLIRRAQEIDPCLTVESIAQGATVSQSMLSTRLCTMKAANADYDLRERSAISYENLRWDNNAFRFRLFYTARKQTSKQTFDCRIVAIDTKPAIECTKAN